MAAKMVAQSHVLEQVGNNMDQFGQHSVSSTLCILFYLYVFFSPVRPM